MCHVPVGSAALCPLCWTNPSAAAAATDLFRLPANTRQPSSHLLSANLACEGLAEGSLTPAPPALTTSSLPEQSAQEYLPFSIFPDGRDNHMSPRSLAALFSPSLFSLPSTSPKSHANPQGGSILLDWIDGPPAFFLLTKATPNMVSYRGIMLRCQSMWACDPRCQSPSGTAVSALTPQHATLTCPAPLFPRRDGADATDKCISMSLLFRSINQYCWRLDWNIRQIYFSQVWFTWRKLRVLISWIQSSYRHCLMSASSSKREANKCLRVVWGQRNKKAENYSFPSCLVISICPPRTSCPSITFHLRQDSCLGVKHIHSSAVHQIEPNTVILHSHWGVEGGGAAGRNA